MNIQALMKQAQNIQKDMEKAKKEIENMEFENKNGFVSVKINGKKQIIDINIDIEKADSEDIEAIQDMTMLALNEAFKKVDEKTNEKMGKFANLPGLF